MAGVYSYVEACVISSLDQPNNIWQTEKAVKFSLLLYSVLVSKLNPEFSILFESEILIFQLKQYHHDNGRI